MARNYYLILGVPADADPNSIRSAFRRLARRYHPDRGAEADERAFREATEAYEVLSDPDRRAAYDQEHPRLPRPAARWFGREVPPGPEPLVSEPIPITGRPEKVRPSLDALADRFARNFSGAEPPKAERLEPLHFELVLSREEAVRGVRIPFRVPVLSRCRACGGSGRERGLPCGDCGGDGRVVDYATVDVELPAGVRDRARFDVSLASLGVRNLWLSLHVRVAED